MLATELYTNNLNPHKIGIYFLSVSLKLYN